MALVKDNVRPSSPILEHTQDDRAIWEIILASGPKIPSEEWAAAPHGGACNYKHYLYDHPKEDVIKI